MLTLAGRADGLLVGALLAVAFENEQVRGYLARHKRTIGMASATFLFAFAALHFGWVRPRPAGLYFVGGFTILSIGFAGIMAQLLNGGRGLLARACEFGPLRFLGAISYFAYLFHQPLNYVVHERLGAGTPQIATVAGVGATAVSGLLLAGLGWLSLRFLERPTWALGRRFDFVWGQGRTALPSTSEV